MQCIKDPCLHTKGPIIIYSRENEGSEIIFPGRGCHHFFLNIEGVDIIIYIKEQLGFEGETQNLSFDMWRRVKMRNFVWKSSIPLV